VFLVLLSSGCPDAGPGPEACTTSDCRRNVDCESGQLCVGFSGDGQPLGCCYALTVGERPSSRLAGTVDGTPFGPNTALAARDEEGRLSVVFSSGALTCDPLETGGLSVAPNETSVMVLFLRTQNPDGAYFLELNDDPLIFYVFPCDENEGDCSDGVSVDGSPVGIGAATTGEVIIDTLDDEHIEGWLRVEGNPALSLVGTFDAAFCAE